MASLTITIKDEGGNETTLPCQLHYGGCVTVTRQVAQKLAARLDEAGAKVTAKEILLEAAAGLGD